MPRLIGKNKSGCYVKLHNPKNDKEARTQLMDAFKKACEKLYKYEDMGEPEELENKRELEKQIAEKALEVGEGNVYLEIMVNKYQEYLQKYEDLRKEIENG